VARLTGDRQFEAIGVVGLAYSAARLGRGAEQRGRLEEVSPWIEGTGVTADYVYGQGVRALLALLAGDRAAARSLADLCVTRAATQPVPVVWTLQGLCGVGDVYEILTAEAVAQNARNAGELRSKFARLLAQLERFAKAYAFADPFYRYYEGRLEEVSGKPKKAQKAWREGLASRHSSGAHSIRGRILRALGTSLGPSLPEGKEALARGRAILAKLGSAEPYDIEPSIDIKEEAC
jgi:hypothetical protein